MSNLDQPVYFMSNQSLPASVYLNSSPAQFQFNFGLSLESRPGTGLGCLVICRKNVPCDTLHIQLKTQKTMIVKQARNPDCRNRNEPEAQNKYSNRLRTPIQFVADGEKGLPKKFSAEKIYGPFQNT
ncbi:jg22122 [Pararge aegeria aegeria]|uniref:Jg22122 protein n=1 Tax=Pararge aegeria aegeria TaxID=348720 RepID=A0A8S4QVS6_9NEOP|nr:jg22122 [Pararge aegeria aegeria]